MQAWLQAHGIVVRSIVWGVLGTTCFVTAASLTFAISHVSSALSATAPERLETDPTGWYAMSLTGEAAAAPIAVNYDYTTQDSEVVISFPLPALVDQLQIVGDNLRCWSGVDGDALQQELAPVAADWGWQVDLFGAAGLITCNMLPRVRHNSFTTTVASFVNMAPADDRVGQSIALTINNREGLSEIAASTGARLGDEIVLEIGDSVTVRFHSMYAEERRDWFILVIGVLVGFGAAMIIEALRPLIERIGRPRAA